MNPSRSRRAAPVIPQTAQAPQASAVAITSSRRRACTQTVRPIASAAR